MMSDLNCELLVTLGDARLDPDTEKKYLEQHEEWSKISRKPFCHEVGV